MAIRGTTALSSTNGPRSRTMTLECPANSAQPTGFELASARSTIESFGLISNGCTVGRLDYAHEILVGVEGFDPSML